MLIGWLEREPADFEAKCTCQVKRRMITLMDLGWTPGKAFREPCTSLRKEQHGLKMTNHIYTKSWSFYSLLIILQNYVNRKSKVLLQDSWACMLGGHITGLQKMHEQSLIFTALYLKTQYVFCLGNEAKEMGRTSF